MAEDKSKEQLAQEQDQKDNDTIKRVIRGVNDTFEKEYTFKELGLNFKIKLTYPSMADNAQVKSILEAYFGGTASFLPAGDMANAYSMMAYINQQQRKYGDDSDKIHIPDILKDIEEVYNPSILIAIHNDFEKWMRQFRY